MDLRDFVSETLVQIIEGVKKAQETTRETGAKISPRLAGSTEFLSRQGFVTSHSGVSQNVHFDVALTVKEGTGTKGGIGIFAGAINIGSTGNQMRKTPPLVMSGLLFR